MTTTAILFTLIQGLLTIAISPMILGVIRKIKARLQGRVGAPLLQGYWDFLKWVRKDSVVSDRTSWVFRVAPYIVVSTALMSAFLIPTFTTLSLSADVIFVGFILVFGTLFLVLSGLDAATTFGAMGSSREAMLVALSEPIFITSLFAVSAHGGSTTTSQIIHATLVDPAGILNPVLVLVLFTFFILALAENSRYPFDNPTTHLELTMVHEAMILENSGKNLALMELGSWVKLTVLLNLVGALVVPWGMAQELAAGLMVVGMIAWLGKLLLGAIAIAVIESTIAKMRLLRIPMLLGMTWAIAAIAILIQFFL